ncbi:hypothetical protein [Gemmata sp.]|uniref:hypothetical protein n=1 Tax=Gemmata sp. TaxID=1914242 RepID=UPI003F70DA3A
MWSETIRKIWSILAEDEAAPPELFGELYRELVAALKVKPSAEELADTIEDQARSREAFESVAAAELLGERAVVKFLESAHDVFDDLGDEAVANRYFNVLAAFVEKYSLRYDLRRPCCLCPTLAGVFTNLFRELRVAAGLDAHLASLMHAFEDGIRDLRDDWTEVRIKTCIQRQMNLLEAFGAVCKGVTGDTLGKICDQVGTWPHTDIKRALKSLYGFASDYPGIRHGGAPSSALRVIELRDLIAISVLLTGFTPYLTDLLDADLVYRGA